MEFNQKIKATHLKRRAILYIRQSTMKQVYENTESTLRQYALKGRLISLGWTEETITVIDCDLGRSGAAVEGRDGFKQLRADVGTGEVGAVACIECSRLSRNSSDWGSLMEICAITKTLLIDADGVYNLNDFNDRILLGLKGTISEAELYLIRTRMIGGKLNKAKRGELKMKLPAGYVYDNAGRVVKDPNADIRNAVQLFFDVFRRMGTARGTAIFFREHGYKFPVDSSSGFGRGEIQWKPLIAAKVCQILRNPVYAGVYAYGQKEFEQTVDKKKRVAKPEDEWVARIENHHEGYVSLSEYYGNIEKLESNCPQSGNSVPREGAALLQGIAVCGKCGLKMSNHYLTSSNGTRQHHYYVCGNDTQGKGMSHCQSVRGMALDEAISEMILESLTPLAISSAIEIEEESRRRKMVSDNYFLLQVERARYDADLARRQYMSVDPLNRLVAFELESLWNERIAELAKAEEELNRHNREKATAASKCSVSCLSGLPEDVGEIWHSGRMRVQDKKRVLRCLIENVTITRGADTTVLGVLFKTGATKVVECENPKPVWVKQATPVEVIEYIREKSVEHPASEISDLLNQGGYKSGEGRDFTTTIVRSIIHNYDIPPLEDHLRAKGYLLTKEKAAQLGLQPAQLNSQRRCGVFKGEWVRTGANAYMYAP